MTEQKCEEKIRSMTMQLNTSEAAVASLKSKLLARDGVNDANIELEVYIPLYRYACTNICMYSTHVYTHMCIHLHAHIHIHKYIYI